MEKGATLQRGGYEEIVEGIKSGKLVLPEGCVMPEEDGDRDAFTTVREATYRGRKICVETTYRITIGGEALRVHTSVLDNGAVHCHGFPNYSFPSALDLARKIIDGSERIEIPENELGDQEPDPEGGCE